MILAYEVLGGEICLGWVKLNAAVAALAGASQPVPCPLAWGTAPLRLFSSLVPLGRLLVFSKIVEE
jgi:hypothetical protein